MKHIGIDFSITSPAICVLGEDETFESSELYFLTSVKKLIGNFGNMHGYFHKEWTDDIQRYEQIAKWVLLCVKPNISDRIYLEGYSVGSTKGKIYQTHENTAILKFYLFKNHLNYVTIPPTEIKKKFNGKGNANKEQMYDTFLQSSHDIRETLGLSKKAKIKNPVSDLVDAYAISLIGKHNGVQKVL